MNLFIVTINYNNAEGLRRTLASVAVQTYRDIEHIIIDGASTDGSVDVIREYAERPITDNRSPLTIIWTSEPDNGIYNAMNKGIEIALGRRVVNTDHTSHIIHQISSQSNCDSYIQILNSGDLLAAPDVTERMMNTIHSFNDKTGIPILLGNIVKVYSEGKMVSEKKMSKANTPKSMDVSMLTFYKGTVPQDAAFVRRDLFEKYGGFDETMKICADWKLYLDMIALGGVVPMYVDIDVVLFDMSGVSNVNHKQRLAERRAYLEKILPPSVLCDYDMYAFPIIQYQRLKKHHLWGLVWFLERVLFKLEKWHILQ